MKFIRSEHKGNIRVKSEPQKSLQIHYVTSNRNLTNQTPNKKQKCVRRELTAYDKNNGKRGRQFPTENTSSDIFKDMGSQIGDVRESQLPTENENVKTRTYSVNSVCE